MFHFKFQVFLLLTALATFSLCSAAVPDEPEDICGPICLMHCVYGNKKDERGCPICECNDPCDWIKCSSDTPYCYEEGCHATPQQTTSAPLTTCPPICEKVCKSGFRKDLNTCEYCECVDPCEEKLCLEDQTCEAVDVVCKTEPCYQVAQCKELCPPVCEMYCPYGNKKDEEGCPICECNDPCDPNPCPSGMYCHMKQVTCVMAPCDDVAQCECFKFKCPPCKYGYLFDENGCQTCQCLEGPQLTKG